jgi:hypothetical protein
MPRQLDPRIAEILRTYGEDPSDQKGVIWDCHGTWVVYHKALERVAARANISFDAPTILRAERDEAVILCTARMGERVDWDIGEALIGVNYRVSGKQAAYVYAMALKRGRDRLILKLTGLHGLTYSEEESDDFRSQPLATPPSMTVEHMLHEIDECRDDEALLALKQDPAFRAGYRAADELSRKRIEQALAKAAEEAAA